MRRAACGLAAGLLWLAAPVASSAQDATATAYDMPEAEFRERRAVQNWMLKCQGCHKPDGSGLEAQGMPDLRGNVAVFLTIDGGREYLSRVPGVTNNALSDEELADVLNWLLDVFDPGGIPADHKPYTAAEVGALRQSPLLGPQAGERRRELLSQRP